MWYSVITSIITGVILWLISPRPKEPEEPEFQYPKASEGTPINLLYGTRLIKNSNVLWVNNLKTKKLYDYVFFIIPVEKGTNYNVTLAMGICLTGNVELKKIEINKTIKDCNLTQLPDDAATFSGTIRHGKFNSNFVFYNGNQTKVPDLGNSNNTRAEQPSYNGISFIHFKNANLGDVPVLPALGFLVSNFTDTLGLKDKSKIDDDANPAEVLYQVLVDSWGGLSYDYKSIDLVTFKACGETLYQEKNGMSLLLTSVQNGQNVINNILQHIDGILQFHIRENKISLKLIRDDYDVKQLPIFDENNIISLSDYRITNWQGTINQVRVIYPDKTRKYKRTAAINQDLGNIGSQGKITSTLENFPYCTDNKLAQHLADRALSRYSTPLYTGRIIVQRKYVDQLLPGELFVLNWPDLNINNMIMRINKINVGSLIDGQITLDIIQDKFSVFNNTFAPSEPTLAPDIALVVIIPENITLLVIPSFIAVIRGFVDISNYENQLNYIQILARNEESQTYINQVVKLDNTNDIIKEYPESIEKGYAPSFLLAEDITDEVGRNGVINIKVNEYKGNDFWLSQIADINRQKQGQNILYFSGSGEYMSFESIEIFNDTEYILKNVNRALLYTRFKNHNINDVIYICNFNDIYAPAISVNDNYTNYLIPKIGNSYGDVIKNDFETGKYIYPPSHLRINNKTTVQKLQKNKKITLKWILRDQFKEAQNKVLSFNLDNQNINSNYAASINIVVEIYINDTLQKISFNTYKNKTGGVCTIPKSAPSGNGLFKVKAEWKDNTKTLIESYIELRFTI